MDLAFLSSLVQLRIQSIKRVIKRRKVLLSLWFPPACMIYNVIIDDISGGFIRPFSGQYQTSAWPDNEFFQFFLEFFQKSLSFFHKKLELFLSKA